MFIRARVRISTLQKDDSSKKRALERKESAIAHIPQQADQAPGPKKELNNSFFFTKMVMEGKQKNDLRSEDPREALLKYDEAVTTEPMFFGTAYEGTQPSAVYAEQTYEQEQESFKKRQADSI